MPSLSEPHIQDAVRAARRARADLGCAADERIEADVLELAELSLGLAVCVLELPQGIAGAYLKKRGQGFVFLQATDYPTRQRFTLAHEIGHHVLRHVGRVDAGKDIGRETEDHDEQQANFFASEFLVPEAAARKWLAEHAGARPGVESLLQVADHFCISPPAMLYRLSKGAFEEFGYARARLDELWQDVKAKKHVELAEQMGIGHGADQLSRHYDETDEGVGAPRLPSQLVDNARAARAAGFITERRLGEVLRRG